MLMAIIKKAAEATIPLAEQPKRKWITEKTLQLVKEKRELRLSRHESEEKVKIYKKKMCNEAKT